MRCHEISAAVLLALLSIPAVIAVEQPATARGCVANGGPANGQGMGAMTTPIMISGRPSGAAGSLAACDQPGRSASTRLNGSDTTRTRGFQP